MARRARAPVQQPLGFRSHGGKRPGAGRKKDKARGLVDHASRPSLSEREPAHVTLRFRKGVWNLRSARGFRTIERALRKSASLYEDARFVHFAVLGNHIHLIVEADDRRVLARRVQGLEIRIARALNRLMERTGRVFADRYHVRVLRGPREVRHAIGYVLRNAARHHGVRGIDPYSSGPFFDGWHVEPRARPTACTGRGPPTLRAKSWALRSGWRRFGLIAIP